MISKIIPKETTALRCIELRIGFTVQSVRSKVQLMGGYIGLYGGYIGLQDRGFKIMGILEKKMETTI